MSEERSIFIRRAINALETIESEAPRAALAEAASQPSDFEVLLQAVQTPAILGELIAKDPFAGARLRGVMARRELLAHGGPPLSGAQVAALLGISRQAVDKRRRAGQLVGVELGRRGYAYPQWQFTDDGDVLPGLGAILDRFADRGVWTPLIFLLSPNAGLDGDVPVERLRGGDLEAVRRAADDYGQHGAH